MPAQSRTRTAYSAVQMCGIVGVIEYRGRRAVDSAVVERMNATLVHRGPDDAGTWSDGPIGIAMRRLSIVDVDGGHLCVCVYGDVLAAVQCDLGADKERIVAELQEIVAGALYAAEGHQP